MSLHCRNQFSRLSKYLLIRLNNLLSSFLKINKHANSSPNRSESDSFLLVWFAMSFIKIEKSVGLSTEPCGTPVEIEYFAEHDPFTLTLKELMCKAFNIFQISNVFRNILISKHFFQLLFFT